MEEYRKLVKKLADEGSSELIANGGTEHAEVLIENIFAHAGDAVRIFSGELNARVYGSSGIVENAKEFLQSGTNHKLDILIQSKDIVSSLEKHDLIKMCLELNTKMCELRLVGETDEDVGHHFVVMDEIGYRFEPDREKPTAVGCFHDEVNAKLLARSFDSMFSRGKVVNLMSEEKEALSH